MARTLLVIGAGPMGLEAALAAIERGFDVTVYEAGRVGEALRRWGPTRLFTPMAMNLSQRARALLGPDAPEESALLTGPEMAERVLAPLARSEPLAGRVVTGARVLSVARRRLGRHDHPNHPIRHERGFRLLIERDGREEEVFADIVFDASGVYGQPLPTGLGGPAIGERAAENRILRTLGALHDARPELRGARVALVGDGASAANAIVALGEWIAAGDGPVAVRWVTRTRRTRPCVETPADPLPERIRINRTANELASSPPAWLEVRRNSTVERLVPSAEGVLVETSAGESFGVDRIVSLTGFRPDLEILRELALDIAPATEGAGPLWRAVSSITDCMCVPAVGPDDLSSGEPGFFLVGHKSYGRSNTFLLSTGRLQLEGCLSLLGPP